MEKGVETHGGEISRQSGEYKVRLRPIRLSEPKEISYFFSVSFGESRTSLPVGAEGRGVVLDPVCDSDELPPPDDPPPSVPPVELEPPDVCSSLMAFSTQF